MKACNRFFDLGVDLRSVRGTYGRRNTIDHMAKNLGIVGQEDKASVLFSLFFPPKA